MSARREPVRLDDLLFAHDWVASYDAGEEGEGGDDAVNAGAQRRILAWLDAEIDRRRARRVPRARAPGSLVRGAT